MATDEDRLTVATKHPVFLTGEDGEPIWIRADVFANHGEALAAYNNEYGALWSLKHPPSKLVHMRSAPEKAPWGDDPEWHEQTDEPGPDTADYWRFDV